MDLFPYDNASAQKIFGFNDCLVWLMIWNAWVTLYFPDLTQSDYHLFPNMIKQLTWTQYRSDEDVEVFDQK